MRDLSFREWAAILPLLILMVWMGTATQTFLPSISAQNALILKQTDARKEVQVKTRPGTDPVAATRRVSPERTNAD
jgi:hypothetical protein